MRRTKKPKLRSRGVNVLLWLTLSGSMTPVDAADHVIIEGNKNLTETKQQQTLMELERQRAIEQLKQDQRSSGNQQEIERSKAKPAATKQTEPAQLDLLQRQIDQTRTEDSLKKLQNEQRQRAIETQTDSLRRQQQLNELQRQQQMDFLQEQIRQNQLRQDLERLR